jgi:glycosyltransferase involved in cell wall biosynthesis
VTDPSQTIPVRADARALPAVSVVVPVYNAEQTLEELCERLVAVLERCASDFEIILVNDGSRDASWQRIQQIARRSSRIRGLDLMRNYGQHNTLLCGIRAARHAVVVTLDDDLQNPPEVIPLLLARLDDDVDVVYGRPLDEQHGFWRNRASQVTKLVLEASMGADIARQISSVRAFRTQLRDAFAGYRGAFVSIDVLLTWATTRFAAVRVEHVARKVGESNYTVRQLVRHALNLVTGFSTLPLQLASMIGFLCTFFGLVVLVFTVGRTLLYGVSVPGFAFLASIIAVFSGAQLFGMGIIGEYLGRIHVRAMDHPVYVVRAHTEPSSSAET